MKRRKLRVALYDASGRGGVTQYTHALAESLSRAGCRVTLLATHDYELRDLPRSFALVTVFKPSWIRILLVSGRSSPASPPLGNPPTSAFSNSEGTGGPASSDHASFSKRARLRLILLRAAARIAITGTDILHVQWCVPGPAEIWFLQLVRRMGVRVVYTAHDVLPHGEPVQRRKEALAALYRAVDHVVVFALRTRDELVGAFGLDEARVSVIPHGSDEPSTLAAPSQELARAEIGIGKDRSVILFFGTIRRYKGLDYLVKALDRVHERVANAVLLVAGGGLQDTPDESSYYQSVVASLRGRTDIVTELQYVPVSRIGVFFAAADVVVLPYVRTYHSGVLLKAYAAGKPVVVTDTGALAETVEEGKTGFVVPPQDTNALADRIVAVIGRRDRGAAMGRNAREFGKTHYSWTAIGQQTAALYRRLLTSVDVPVQAHENAEPELFRQGRP